MKASLAEIRIALERSRNALEIAQDNGQDVALEIIAIDRALESVKILAEKLDGMFRHSQHVTKANRAEILAMIESGLTPSSPEWENTDISRLAKVHASEVYSEAKHADCNQ